MIKRGLKIRIPVQSIRFRIIFVVTSTVLVLLLILLFNNVYAIKVVRNQVFETNQKMLTMYMNRIDDAFQDVENYWVGLQLSENLATVEYTKKEIDYYTAQARLKHDMENVLPTYGFIDDLFVYFSENDSFLNVAKYDISGEEQKYIRQMVISASRSKILDDNSKGKWIGMEAGGEYYLVRILRVHKIYMGGCAKVTKLIGKLRKDGFGNMEYVALCEKSGQEYGNSLPKLDEKISMNNRQDYFSMVGENHKYMLLSVNSKCGDYGLVALIRDNYILEGLDSIQKLIRFLCIVLALFLISFIFAVGNWIIRPMDNLIKAMKSLASGNLEVRLQSNKACDEFVTLNKTFDNMIEQIKSLKIDIYEERVQRQKAELQYLKLQVNPHFYINCLSVIHNLSIMNKNNLVQEMTTYLGNHLRYTMEGNSLDCLYKEIDYVRNYLSIQKLRFSDSIICNFDIEEAALEVMVPPLIIQTFIENTVKYQVVTGEITEIYIKIKICQVNDKEDICIEIWDTGDGFPEEILVCLANQKRIFDKKGEHFGINNVQQRLNLIYQNKASIVFANHQETGGAYIKITLPTNI